ncbi:MAG TPA: TraC family protein [Syntrophales bacterium]|nr:TraC family protein [Syntrophales bacterium]
MGFRDFLYGRDRDLSVSDLNEMTARNRFSVYLPWVSYDSAAKTYHNTDDTTGFIWECAPLSFAGDKTAFTLEGLFRIGLPAGSVLQFILYADKYINRFIDLFKSGKTRAVPIVQEATEHYSEFLRSGVDGMEIFQRTPLRNFRLFIALKLPHSRESSRMSLMDLYSTAREILNGAGMAPRDVTPEILIDWMRKLFNENPPFNNGHYHEEIPIKKQVILSETVIEKRMSHIKMGNRFFRCTTVKNFPKEVDLFQTNEIFGGIWGLQSDANQFLTPFLYSLNIVFQDMKAKLHYKCNLVLQQKGAGSFTPSLVRKQDEYMRAVDDLEKGVPFVRIVPTLWVWSGNEKSASESIVRARRIWESKGYVMQEDKGILLPLMISSLPFGLYLKGKNLESLDRDFTAASEPVSMVLPIQGDFCGGGYPHLLFIGRKGQPCALDIFSGRGVNNHNVFIAASSGSGKSFLVNFIAYNYFAANAMIRIVDIGGSYKKTTGLFGARYLDFHSDSGICLNPFTYVDRKAAQDDLPVIASLVHAMCFSATDVIPFDTAETSMSIIKDAVRWAWDNEGPEACIDSIYRYLSRYPQYAPPEFRGYSEQDMAIFRNTAQMLACNLRDFTSGQSYGRWFNGVSNFDISRDEWVVLELENLKPQKQLFKIVTLQVINAVTQDLYLSDRSRNRLIIFDEAWQFIRGENAHSGGARTVAHMKEVIEEGYRRARKYGGSFTVITQSLLDLKQFGSVGDVIRANSAFKMYLESPDFEKAKAEGLIDCGEFGMALLKSLKSNKPKYSEIFMDTPFGMGISRLAVDPYSYYIYTSDAREIAEIESMVKEGMDYAGAIAEMVRKYRGNGDGRRNSKDG